MIGLTTVRLKAKMREKIGGDTRFREDSYGELWLPVESQLFRGISTLGPLHSHRLSPTSLQIFAPPMDLPLRCKKATVSEPTIISIARGGVLGGIVRGWWAHKWWGLEGNGIWRNMEVRRAYELLYGTI
jgi:hypothetical protein